MCQFYVQVFSLPLSRRISSVFRFSGPVRAKSSGQGKCDCQTGARAETPSSSMRTRFLRAFSIPYPVLHVSEPRCQGTPVFRMHAVTNVDIRCSDGLTNSVAKLPKDSRKVLNIRCGNAFDFNFFCSYNIVLGLLASARPYQQPLSVLCIWLQGRNFLS